MDRALVHDVIQFLIGALVLVCCFTFLYLIFFSGRPVQPEMHDALSQVIGGVLGIIGMIVGFYFGYSLASTIAAKKDPPLPKGSLKEGQVNA